MVAQPEKLELCLLSTASEDMAKMTELEEKLQLSLRQKVNSQLSYLGTYTACALCTYI